VEISAPDPVDFYFCRLAVPLSARSGTGVFLANIHQAPSTLPAEIPCLVSFYPVMSPGSQVVQLATASIVELTEFSPGQAFKVVLARGPHVCAEESHDMFPFLAMRADVAETVHRIRDVMGHFVRYGLRQVVLEVPRENERVITDHPFPVADTVHPGCPPPKIKEHRNFGKFSSKQIRRLADSESRLLYDETLVKTSNRIQEYSLRIFSIPPPDFPSTVYTHSYKYTDIHRQFHNSYRQVAPENGFAFARHSAAMHFQESTS